MPVTQQLLEQRYYGNILQRSFFSEGSSQAKVSRTFKFMGHDEKIHKKVYLQPELVDIVQVSKDLEKVSRKKSIKRNTTKDLTSSADNYSSY